MTEHGGPEGSDPYFHDSKRHPSQDTNRGRDSQTNSKYNPSAGSQCQACTKAANRCGAKLPHSERRYGEDRYCTRLPVDAFNWADYPDEDRCRYHQETDD